MPRKIILLALLLSVLCALSFFLFWKTGRVENTRPLKSIQAGDASKILLDRGGESLAFEKKEGRWLMTAPVSDAADPQALEDLLSGLIQLSVGTEISRDPANYAAYDLNESSAARVRLYLASDAAPAFDGYFGKNALGYDSLYFRFAREKPVYFSSGISPYHIGRAANEFRDHALTTIEKDALQKIKLGSAKNVLELNKSSAGWISEGKTLPQEKTDAILSALLNLKIADFPAADEPTEGAGLDKPFLSVELSGAVKTTKFSIGRTRPEKGKPVLRYARIEGRNTLVLVSSQDVEALVKLYN